MNNTPIIGFDTTKHVLVVDDDDGLRNLIEKTLRHCGYEVSGVSNGEQAVNAVAADPSMVVLLDQKLPDMTGRDIVTALEERGVSFSFIVMTGQGDERLAVEMMKLGAADYLIKDTDFIDLLPGVLNRIFRSIETEKRLLQAEQEKERLQAQLLQSQKMESIGRLAGGVAHDFNNMLGAILGYTELAMDRLDPSNPLMDDLKQIRSAAKRSADLTRQLLAFARKQTVTPKPLNPNKVVEGMLKMLRRLIGENITLDWYPSNKISSILMDPSQMDQILVNLCVNAKDAIEGTGTVAIKTSEATLTEADSMRNVELMPGNYVVLSISDNGHGMDEKTISHLFEPFFTTKEIGKGVGLGLATVYGIVTQNHGCIDVISAPQKGTTFNIYFPKHSSVSDIPKTDDKSPSKNPPSSSPRTILLVEDEPLVLTMAVAVLERSGYRVISTGTPKDAVELAKKHACEIDLLITDVVMPEMNGRDLAQKLLSICPNLKALFMSGYSIEIISKDGILDEGMFFIQKPFTVNGLSTKVKEVLSEL